MPRVAVPATPITRAGIIPAAEVNGDAANNHSVVNDGKTYVLVRNASGAVARTVTFKFSDTVDGQTVASRTKSIPLGETHRFGPWPQQWYGQSLQVDVEHADLKLSAYSLAGP